MKRKSHQVADLGRTTNRKKKQRPAVITTVHPSTAHGTEDLVISTSSSSSSSLPMPLLDVPVFMTTKVKKRCLALSSTASRDPTFLLSNYASMGNETFKRILSNFMTATASIAVDDQSSSAANPLDHEEIVIYLRQLTHLKNMACYFQLQIKQWSHYLHVGMIEKIWTGRMPSKLAMKNSICPAYGRRKHVIEQRINNYRKKLEKNNGDMNNHMERWPSLVKDRESMISVIEDLVIRDQHELRMDVERRQTLLQLDAKDHQLLQAFHALKPKRAQIEVARTIWKAVYDEKMLQYELAMFETWLALRSTPSTVCSLHDLHLTTINQLLVQAMFDQPLNIASESSSSQQNAYEQMIKHLADRVIADMEALVQNYRHKGIREEAKLSKLKPKSQDVTLHGKIMSAFEARRQQLSQRLEYDTEQKQRLLRA